MRRAEPTSRLDDSPPRTDNPPSSLNSLRAVPRAELRLRAVDSPLRADMPSSSVKLLRADIMPRAEPMCCSNDWAVVTTSVFGSAFAARRNCTVCTWCALRASESAVAPSLVRSLTMK
eukprot:scaffold23710_cov64-Phaeocystis_antarctica.AAC.2